MKYLKYLTVMLASLFPGSRRYVFKHFEEEINHAINNITGNDTAEKWFCLRDGEFHIDFQPAGTAPVHIDWAYMDEKRSLSWLRLIFVATQCVCAIALVIISTTIAHRPPVSVNSVNATLLSLFALVPAVNAGLALSAFGAYTYRVRLSTREYGEITVLESKSKATCQRVAEALQMAIRNRPEVRMIYSLTKRNEQGAAPGR